MRFVAFILNYGLAEKAVQLRDEFSKHMESHVLSSASPKDPSWFMPGQFVHKYPNIHYTGLWNEAVSLFMAGNANAMWIVTSDVTIDDVSRLVSRSKLAFSNQDVWEYAPEVDTTAFKHPLLSKLKAIPQDVDMRVVPVNEGICVCLLRELAKRVGKIDPEINQFGCGIDQLTGLIAKDNKKLSIRDYGVVVRHPAGCGYDRDKALKQMKIMLDLKRNSK